MSTGVIITLIICVTLIILSIISQVNRYKKPEDKSQKLETPEDQKDYFKKF